jgi:hypothetical protein
LTVKHAYDEGVGYLVVTCRVLQEEGGYENASYPGTQPAGEEAHVEEGLLHQPLEAGAGEVKDKPGVGVVRLCSTDPTATGLCARYADFLGLEGLAKNIWHKAKGAWHAFANWVHSNAHAIKSALCDITGWGSGLLSGTGATLLTDGNWLFGGSVGFGVGKGVEHACNEQ